MSVHGGGYYPSMHCRWYPSMPCSRGGLLQGGVWSRGCLVGGGLLLSSLLGGFSSWRVWTSVMAFCCGLLLKVAFCCGLLLWPSVEGTFWYGLLEGARRQHQKATTPEGHHTRRPPQRGCLVETPRTATAAGGTHTTGMDSCCA